MKKACFFILLACMLGCKGEDRITDLFQNGDLHFYKLNINDSYEIVKRKIASERYQLKEENGISWIAKEYIVDNEKAIVVYPNNQIIEEKMNMEFILWYYDMHVISFTKFNIKDADLEMIEKWFLKKAKAEYEGRFINYNYSWDGIDYIFQINTKTKMGVITISEVKYFSTDDME